MVAELDGGFDMRLFCCVYCYEGCVLCIYMSRSLISPGFVFLTSWNF